MNLGVSQPEVRSCSVVWYATKTKFTLLPHLVLISHSPKQIHKLIAINPANSCVYKIKKNSIKNVLPFFFQSLQSSSIPHTAFVHRGRQNPENTSCHIAALKQHYATILSLNNSFKIIMLVQCLVTRPPLSLWQVPNYTKWQFLQNAALKLKAYLEP